MKKKTLVEVLENRWYDISKLPEYVSFRCLICFQEIGFDGDNHISTGWYWHLDKTFTIDNNEMVGFTPIQFFPIYSDIVD